MGSIPTFNASQADMHATGFFGGLGAVFSGLGLLIWEKSLHRLAAIPVFINLAVVLVLTILYATWFVDLRDTVWPAPVISAWYDYLLTGMWYVFNIAFLGASLFWLLVVFLLLGNLLGSAFHEPLSASTSGLLNQAPVQDERTLTEIMKGTGTGFLHEFGKLVLFVMLQIPGMVMWFFPGIGGFLATAWGAGVTWWFLALEFLDYPMTRNSLAFREKINWINNHLTLSLGFGLGACLVLFIPVINLLTMPACVVGATLMWHRQEERERQSVTITTVISGD